jgi:hypothetical protein
VGDLRLPAMKCFRMGLGGFKVASRWSGLGGGLFFNVTCVGSG